MEVLGRPVMENNVLEFVCCFHNTSVSSGFVWSVLETIKEKNNGREYFINSILSRLVLVFRKLVLKKTRGVNLCVMCFLQSMLSIPLI